MSGAPRDTTNGAGNDATVDDAVAEGAGAPFGLARRAVIAALGLTISVASLYTAGFGVWDEILQRVLTVGVSAVLAALVLPLGGRGQPPGPRRLACAAADAALVAAIALAVWWLLALYDELEGGLYTFTLADQAVAGLGLAALLELTRRAFGLPLFLMALLAIAYCVFGQSLPWIFAHAGFPLEQVVRTLWYSFDGVFGRPVMVVLSLILVYVVFGTVLEGTGAAGVLLRIAFTVTGRTRGGPGHAAVVASALFGSISGSAAANVVGTGVFTIPVILRRGFPASFAAGIEAAASTGGQFMPPVMGAVAFMMADVTGIPYLTICAAALLPAVFYYVSLLAAVHAEAVRQGIRPVPVEDRPRLGRADILPCVSFAGPLAVVVGVMLLGYSAALAGFAATVAAVLFGLLVPGFRRDPKRLYRVLVRAGTSGATLMVAVAVIGIIVGAMNLTGLGLRFSVLVLSFAGDSLFIALLLMMAGCLVLGMGMPTVPAYLIIVLTMGSAMAKLGVTPLLTHLFVLYFGCLSAVTPPVALAAYAAAPIAGANPMTTGFVAMRLSLVGFLVPFVLVYNPSLSLVQDFSPVEFAWILLRLPLAIWLFTTGFAGVDRAAIGVAERIVRVGFGFAVLVPLLEFEVPAAIAGVLLLVHHRQRALRAGAASSLMQGRKT